MFANIWKKPDLTKLKKQIATLQTSSIIVLKQKRLRDLYLLETKQDGDPVWDENGQMVMWTPAIRSLIEAEVAEVDELIAELTQ